MRKSSSYRRSFASRPAAIAWLKAGASKLTAKSQRSHRTRCRSTEMRNTRQRLNLRTWLSVHADLTWKYRGYHLVLLGMILVQGIDRDYFSLIPSFRIALHAY